MSGWFDSLLGEQGAGLQAGAAGGRESSVQAAGAVVRQLAPELVLGLIVMVLATVQLAFRLKGQPLGAWSDVLLVTLLLLAVLPLGVLTMESTLLRYRFELLSPDLDQAMALRLRLDAWLAEFSPAIAVRAAGIAIAPVTDDLDGLAMQASAEVFVESLRAPGSPQPAVGVPA